MGHKNAREVALEQLVSWETGGVWSQRKLSEAIRRAELDKRDAALAVFLSNGVLQNLTYIDDLLARHSKIKPAKLETLVLCILRLGVFQLRLTDSMPERAAVYETVALCKGKASRAKGFVNAVLRAVARESSSPLAPEERTPESLSIRYSHPRWIVDELIQQCGIGFAQDVLAHNNLPVPVTIQINTLKTSEAQLRPALEAESMDCAPHPWMPGTLELRSVGDLEQSEAFRGGAFWVQDVASRLAVHALGSLSGKRILDLCAAPGGKSFAAYLQSGGTGVVTSCDIHPGKLKKLAEGAKRLGFPIQTRCSDATEAVSEWTGQFDVVLCDVPCSGLGIIRKKPDIRFASPDRVQTLPDLQYSILRQAAEYLVPGGLLLYSTCTWRTPENDTVIDKFLRSHPEFQPEPFVLPAPIRAVPEGRITLWPPLWGTDGFFICLMRKINV